MTAREPTGPATTAMADDDDATDREDAGLLRDDASQPPPPRPLRPWHSTLSQITYLSLCSAINGGVYFQYHAVPSCATLLRREFDLTATQIGTLQSMYSLPTIFVIFFSGLLVDALGLWASCLIFGAMVLFASVVWCGVLLQGAAGASAATVFMVGIVAQGLLGIGGESLFVAQKALLGASFGTAESQAAAGAARQSSVFESEPAGGGRGSRACEINTGVAFGVSQTTAKLAQAAALWVMPPVAVAFGLFPAFLFATGVCGVSLLCNVTGAVMGRKRRHSAAAAAAAAAAGQPSRSDGSTPEKESRCAAVSSLCKTKQPGDRSACGALPYAYWILLLCLCAGSSVSSSMDALYTDMLVEWFGYSIEFAGRVSSLQFALSAAGTPLLGVYLDRKGNLASALALGRGVEFIALVSLWLVGIPEFQAVAMGVAKVLTDGALWPCVARLVPVERFGCAFGVIVLGQNIAMTVGPPTSGFLRDSSGNYEPVMWAWSFMTGLGLVSALVLRWDDQRTGGKLERAAVSSGS